MENNAACGKIVVLRVLSQILDQGDKHLMDGLHYATRA
jgi:hypothetical protein